MFALWLYHPSRLTGRKEEEAGKDSIITRMDNLDAIQDNARQWGRDAAIRWLMRKNGWNLKTALAAIRIHRQLYAIECYLETWQAE